MSCVLALGVRGVQIHQVVHGIGHIKHIANGDGYYEQAKYAEAILEYKIAISLVDIASSAHFKLAEAYGAVGLRATKPEEVEPVIREAFAVNKPVLMEFVVAQEEGVYPMVPAGKNISEMLLV